MTLQLIINMLETLWSVSHNSTALNLDKLTMILGFQTNKQSKNFNIGATSTINLSKVAQVSVCA